jgi:arsenate reductase-like glutaredoxin family protein
LQNNFDIVERDIFDDPLSESEIVEFLKYTDIDYMFAKRSPSVKKMGLDVDTMSEQEKNTRDAERTKIDQKTFSSL